MPGPVNTCDLKSPHVDVKTALPPVAVMYAAVAILLCKPSSVTNQPCVESMKTNVTEIPSTDIVPFSVAPPIISEPF